MVKDIFKIGLAVAAIFIGLRISTDLLKRIGTPPPASGGTSGGSTSSGA